MPRIRLIGRLEMTPERRDAVLAALPAHIALTRREPGCLDFEVSEDLEDPLRLTVSELFASREAFDAHQQRAASSAWADASRGLKRVYDIQESEDENR
jgi:quinol monooxygenase YgiN